MTVESYIARENSYKFEAKKDALRQNQDGGCKLTININPDDMDFSLFAEPMGQRFMVVMVAIGDDEQPKERADKRKLGDMKKSNQAALLCDQKMFQEFMNALTKEHADKLLKVKLGISSKSELDNADYGFSELVKKYEAYKTTRQYENYMR